MHIVEQMLGAYSEVWGGAANVLVPVENDGTIHKCFLRLLRLYDPDYIAHYSFTPNDLTRCDPKRFKAWQEQWRSELASSGVKPDGIDDFIKRQARESGSSGILPPCLIAEIKQVTSPFHWREHLHRLAFSLDGDPPSELTDLTLLSNFRDLSSYTLFDVRKLPAHYRLAVLAATGDASPRLRSAIEKNDVPCNNHDCAELDFQHLMHFVWNGNGNIDLGGKRGSPSFTWNGTPLGRSVFGCIQFTSDPFSVGTAVPIIVGSEVEDFCLYLFLNRLRGLCYWIPSEVFTGDDELAKNYRSALVRSLNEHQIMMRRKESTYAISSVSCEKAELQQIKNFLETRHFSENDIQIHPATEIPVSHTLAFLDAKATNLRTPAAFVDGALA